MPAYVSVSDALMNSPAVNDFFGGQCPAFNNDNVMMATLRCLMLKREFEGMALSEEEKNFLVTGPAFVTKNLLKDQFLSITDEALNSDEFKEDRLVTQYLRQRTGNDLLSVSINVEEHRTIVFCPAKITLKTIRMIASVIFRLLPWMFPNNMTEGSEEARLFESIDKNDMVTWKEIMGKLEKGILPHLEQHYISTQIAELVCQKRKLQIEQLTNKIEMDRHSYNNLYSDLCNKQKEINQMLNELQVLELMEDSDGEEIIDLFKSNRTLQLDHVDRGKLYYTVTAPLEFYNEDRFENIYRNKKSWLYGHGNTIAEFIKTAFLDNKFQIYTSASFLLEFPDSLNPVGRAIYLKNYSEVSMPHPHLYYHRCIGNNGPVIAEHMKNGDVVGAILQSISAVKNINFSDTVVCRSFANHINKNWNVDKCIEYQGRRMTCWEAAELLKEEKKNAV